MKPVNPQFIPEKGLEKEEMKRMQREISQAAEFQDSFDFEIEDIEEKKVAGIDQAFTEERCVTSVVVMQDGEVVGEVSASAELEIPYIPGLLAFREGNSIVKALEKLGSQPDLLMLDGSGRIHFREAGIATHIGVIFDVPSIGVAKNLLCGETEEREMEKGEKVPVKADEKIVTAQNGEKIGYTFQSKQYSGERKVNPLYVSPGHRIGEESAVKVVEKFCSGYKLPEPTRLADELADRMKVG
jgi:deoxyribonuclease V